MILLCNLLQCNSSGFFWGVPMSFKFKNSLAIAALALTFSMPALASTYEDALAALRAGDHATAKTKLESICNDKDSTGCVTLGQMYQNELGVKYDKNVIRKLYQQGCDGHLNADGSQYYSAWACQLLGIDVQFSAAEADKLLARNAFKRGCDHPDKTEFKLGSCIGYAQTLRDGKGGPVDRMAAAKLLAEQCEYEKHGQSCHILGNMAENRPDGKFDYPYIGLVYNAGCVFGYKPSCSRQQELIDKGLISKP